MDSEGWGGEVGGGGGSEWAERGSGVITSLTFPSQMGSDTRFGSPPVRPGALILPAGGEEGSGGKGLRREKDRRTKRTESSFITCSDWQKRD